MYQGNGGLVYFMNDNAYESQWELDIPLSTSAGFNWTWTGTLSVDVGDKWTDL